MTGDRTQLALGMGSGFLIGRILSEMIEFDDHGTETLLLRISCIVFFLTLTYFGSRIHVFKRESEKAQSPKEDLEEEENKRDKKLLRQVSSFPLPVGEKGPKWWTLEEKAFSEEQEKMIEEVVSRFFNESAPEHVRKPLEPFVVAGDKRSAAARALQARQWRFEEAVLLLKKTSEWRRSERIDDYLEEPLLEKTVARIRSCLFDGFSGLCNNGFPIYILLGGRMDLTRAKKEVALDDIVRYHIQVMEYNLKVYYPKISKAVGQTRYKVTLLLDLTGFGSHNVRPSFWDVTNVIGNIDNEFYFEYLHKVVIVNAGVFFRFFWKTTASLLHQDTRKKFVVLQSKKEIFDHIPKHQLPKYFGGTVEDQGSFCTKDNPWTHHYREMDAHMRSMREDKASAS